jgi:dienelactone hydrolase
LAEERLLVEETFLSVVIKDKPYALEALVAKQLGGAAKLPIALITHGQPLELEQREAVSSRSYLRTAREFARRGWLAVVVVRRGFGQSGGKAPYALRGCRDSNYSQLLDDQADDLQAALAAIAKRPDADPSQALAVGVSVGGATVLNLAARNPYGLRAVVNVSGGVQSVSRSGEGAPTCTADDLVSVFAALGARSRLPTLWLYAENDSLFPAEYVRKLHETYVSGGGRTEFHMFDAIGKDGHQMLMHPDGMLRWIPVLDRFLRAHNLSTYDPAPAEAAVRELGLTPAARQVFARYRGRPTEKALAISQSNKTLYVQFGGVDLGEVETRAREECARQAKEPCRILLRNFEHHTAP